jgi:hypothetical protein
MKEMILAAIVALVVTTGVASAGIASLADAATILISAIGHPDPYGNTVNGLGGHYILRRGPAATVQVVKLAT